MRAAPRARDPRAAAGAGLGRKAPRRRRSSSRCAIGARLAASIRRASSRTPVARACQRLHRRPRPPARRPSARDPRPGRARRRGLPATGAGAGTSGSAIFSIAAAWASCASSTARRASASRSRACSSRGSVSAAKIAQALDAMRGRRRRRSRAWRALGRGCQRILCNRIAHARELGAGLDELGARRGAELVEQVGCTRAASRSPLVSRGTRASHAWETRLDKRRASSTAADERTSSSAGEQRPAPAPGSTRTRPSTRSRARGDGRGRPSSGGREGRAGASDAPRAAPVPPTRGPARPTRPPRRGRCARRASPSRASRASGRARARAARRRCARHRARDAETEVDLFDRHVNRCSWAAAATDVGAFADPAVIDRFRGAVAAQAREDAVDEADELGIALLHRDAVGLGARAVGR